MNQRCQYVWDEVHLVRILDAQFVRVSGFEASEGQHAQICGAGNGWSGNGEKISSPI